MRVISLFRLLVIIQLIHSLIGVHLAVECTTPETSESCDEHQCANTQTNDDDLVANLCERLTQRQRVREEVVLLRWTDPMLTLVHHMKPQCTLPDQAPPDCNLDEIFAANFNMSCGKGAEVPCRPTELPRDRLIPTNQERVIEACYEYGLEFPCVVKDRVVDVANVDSLLDADLIVFDGTNTRVWGVPILPSVRCDTQLWAMYEFRPASVYPFLRDPNYTDLFNVTIGYSRNWTIWSPDFIPPNHYYTRRAEPSAEAPVMMMISQCNTPNRRINYLAELMRHIRIDSYGKCLHNTDFPDNLADVRNKYAQKAAVVQRYKFTIAFENSNEPDYVTEKIHNALSEGSVPVYWGAPNVDEYAPTNSYVNAADFESPQALAEHLQWLLANPDEYAKLLAWKGKPAEAHMQTLKSSSRAHYLCQLCAHVDNFLQDLFV